MAQGYKFALDPGPSQAAKFASFNGGRRTARNTMLGLIKANLGQREAEKSYGIADLTPGMSWSAFSLRKQWNQIKGEVAPWWAENSKEVYASGLADLADALHNWSESKKGTRKGPRMGFPRFEKKREGRAHFTFTTGAIRVEPDRHHVVLPCLGRIKTHESTRKLARRLENGSARILRATVTQQHGRWFVSFNCLVERAVAMPRPAASVVGIDLGVNDLIVVARPDGAEVERVKAPADLRHAMRRVRALSRQVSRRTQGSCTPAGVGSASPAACPDGEHPPGPDAQADHAPGA